LLGYAIVGASLIAFVQARNVFPQLLIARMAFSIGGAATSVPPLPIYAESEWGLIDLYIAPRWLPRSYLR